MAQLPLDLGLPEAPPHTVLSRSNEAAYRFLAGWPRWPHPIAMVTGPPGSGKSHLAARFAEAAAAALADGRSLSPEMAVAIASPGAVVVDDAHEMGERALFHLINAVRSAGGTLLLTATSRPVGGLADLASRLRAIPEIALQSPDEPLIRKVMIDGFQRRQLPVNRDVLDFLMPRMERTLHAAVAWPEVIDREGLAARRSPTRPFAARLLSATGSPARRDMP